jgi:Na+/H+-dicarboxylate symporter
MILSSVGIPTSGIALIMGVDRILDMSRTAVNVAGDLVTCKVMDRLLGEKTEISLGEATVRAQKVSEDIKEEKVSANSELPVSESSNV